MTKADVKEFIIRRILGETIPNPWAQPGLPARLSDREWEERSARWEADRKALATKLGWKAMTAEQLLAQLPDGELTSLWIERLPEPQKENQDA